MIFFVSCSNEAFCLEEEDPRIAVGNGAPQVVRCLPSKQSTPAVLCGDSKQMICDLLDVLCQPLQSNNCLQSFNLCISVNYIKMTAGYANTVASIRL